MLDMECAEWSVKYPCDVSEVDPEILAVAVESAQSILWSLSGRRFGVCTITETYNMPCTSPCVTPWSDDFGPGVEWRLNGDWMYRRQCCAIHLDHQPVRSIDTVIVNGVALDPDEYYLGRNKLYRIGECFPCEEDCEYPPVVVTYSYGIDPPALSEFAMGELTCEILAAFEGADCRLPSNAISVTRQGVTVDLGDVRTLIETGRVGLPLVDAFLRNVNPNNLSDRSRVYSPDLSRRVR